LTKSKNRLYYLVEGNQRVGGRKMIEVAGIQNPQIKVMEDDSVHKIKRYLEIMQTIEKLKKEADKIKEELKNEGIGVDEPEKFEIPGIGIVKVSLKIATRVSIDKKKAKELLPEMLYKQLAKVKEVQMYEIRQVKR